MICEWKLNHGEFVSFVFVQKDNPNLTQKNTMTFDDFIKKNHPQKPYALMDLDDLPPMIPVKKSPNSHGFVNHFINLGAINS